MADVKNAGNNIFIIDDELYSIKGLGSVYFLAEDKKVLTVAWPSTSSKTILRGIVEAGYRPEDVDYLILTHIHLDHAGGAGTLLKLMPRAKVIAHSQAMWHLSHLSKLVKSTLEAQGVGSGARNGEMLPIAADRRCPQRISTGSCSARHKP